jgi:uncharacterized glyoxalase superfamily protein PhnB
MPSHEPLDVGSVYPSLYYDDAPAAIDWLARAFGFRTRLVVPAEGGAVMHAELTLGGAVVMLATARTQDGCASPRGRSGVSGCTCVRVEDPDAHFARARAAGATILRELRDEDYGSRGYSAADLEGHRWYFGTYRPGEHWTA